MIEIQNDTLEFVARLVSALAWPLTTVAVVLWFVRSARHAGLLTDLKARIQTIKAGPAGVEASFFEYGTSPIDDPMRIRSQKPLRPDLAPGARFDRPANIYWLGHDLPWTIDAILRGADKTIVIYGLRQSVHHLESVGLGDSAAGLWLDKVLDPLEKQTRDLDLDQRGQLAQNLQAIVELVGAEVAAGQPDFHPGPRMLGDRHAPKVDFPPSSSST